MPSRNIVHKMFSESVLAVLRLSQAWLTHVFSEAVLSQHVISCIVTSEETARLMRTSHYK